MYEIHGPIVKSGKFHAGIDCKFGDNIIVNVSEELVIGDRCVIPDNAHFEGRRISIGDDWFGYSWEWKRLDIGRSRRDSEHSILSIGDRCTTHENRIDLSRPVVIGDDVGLSPEVALYCHGYWQSVLEGYPARYAGVTIEENTIIGFRSLLLPGASVGRNSVVGAQSVVCGRLEGGYVYGGSPAKIISRNHVPDPIEREGLLNEILNEYLDTLKWRELGNHKIQTEYPVFKFRSACINVETLTLAGDEDEFTDDVRDFLFRRGVRIYTKRLFRRLGKQ